MFASPARQVAQTASHRIARSFTRRIRVSLFAAATLLPAVAAAQTAPAETVPATTLAPVPVAVLAPVQIAPPQYDPMAMQPYPPPGFRPRTRTMVEPYHGGDIPFGSELTTRGNTAMIAAGAASLGITWLGSVVGWFASIRCGGFFSCSSASGWLWLPAAGPWLALADPATTSDPGFTALIVADGIMETASIALMIAGGSLRQQVVVTRTLADNRGARREPPAATWAIAPLTGNGQHGLMATGTF